ncbi:MAG: cysteine synthase family protein [Candidatus Glassbacteria bacterium]|nr:cysteine synthase family protein [Candidatus Glassbacteria bacterium]
MALKQSKPCESVLDAFHETPLVELSRVGSGLDGRILAKLEYFSPGLSKKDRIALQMVEDAERSGALRPGQTVVELTSGNTGTGLAIVCAVKGYPFVAVMSRGNSKERAGMMAALGAEVVLVELSEGAVIGQVSGESLKKVEDETQRIVRERNAFRADQFNLEANRKAHYLHTGPEIIRQSGGMVTAFCDFAGTGGSFAGIAKALREHNPEIMCFLVEPESVAVLAGRPVECGEHKIQGGGYAMTDLRMLEGIEADGFVQVEDKAAIHWARKLAAEEGIFGGFSSGANLAAAVQLLQGPCRGGTVAILVCDSGLKYLSTDLWTPPA